MKCSIVLCVGALVALAASKPTDKLNRNHSSLEISNEVTVTEAAVRTSDLRNFVIPSGESHRRVRRTVWSDGKKCSVGKIRVGHSCLSCEILQKSNPHACKNRNETLDSQMATQEVLSQQSSSTSIPNTISSSNWLTSDITIIFSSSSTTSSPEMTTVLDSSGFVEVSSVQSDSLSFNASSQILASNCLCNLVFVYLILCFYVT